MNNILEYLKEHKDSSYATVPFNEVDEVILSWISYLPYTGIVSPSFSGEVYLGNACAKILGEKRNLAMGNDRSLMELVADSGRFGPMKVSGFVETTDAQIQTQYASCCIDTNDGMHFVSYRGTDASLVGWKEDFNMSFQSPIPGQSIAAEYLAKVLRAYSGKVRVGGVSKGGNLAMYATSFAGRLAQRRVHHVTNGDGPGFDASTIGKSGYQRMKGRILSLLPESSVVGMLLDHEEAYRVVKSTATGIFQHNPYSWTVKGTAFVVTEDVDGESKYIDRTLKKWLAGMSNEDRERFVDEAYGIVSKTGAGTVDEIASNWPKNTEIIFREIRDMDPNTKRFFHQVLWLLLKASVSSAPNLREPYEKMLRAAQARHW